jgi:ATP adenylyltransferase
MKTLWAPWRMKYIMGNKPKDCIFCAKIKENKDRENYVLFRGNKSFIMLNLYPYNAGHILIAPYQHCTSLNDLDTETANELMALVVKSSKLLEEILKPAALNVGMNIGKAAGAGEEHIHIHLVPRWQGDSNFMPVIAETKVIPELLDNTYAKLLAAITDKK